MRPKNRQSRSTPRRWFVPALASGLLLIGQAEAARVVIRDVKVSYTDQTPSHLAGMINFTVAFDGLNGDPGGYDFFSVQLTILGGGDRAAFTLDQSMTENTAVIADYWLANAPTGNQNASLQSAEQYRFADFVSIAESVTPQPGAALARFVVGFEATTPDQFGTYTIAAGNASFNKFSSDIVNGYPNVVDSAAFQIGCSLADMDLDCDADQDDVAIFLRVLLGTDSDPTHTILADINQDGTPDGRDAGLFVGAFVGS